MKKLEPHDLPTKEDQKLRQEEYAHKFEAVNKIVTSPGWKYIKEILLKNANEEELKTLLSQKGITEFDKVGQLVYLEHRANLKLKAGINECESYIVK